MIRVFPLSLALLPLLLLLLLLTTAAAEDDADLDVLLNNLFTTDLPNPAPVDSQEPCEQGQRCVPKYRCTNASTSGEGLIDIRFSESNPCVDYLLQCCYEEDIIAEPTTVVERPIDDHPVCGKRNLKGIGFRITGAQHNESEYGEFPWMVAVSRHVEVLGYEVSMYLCGGSIVHPKVVLTAVHCVRNQLLDQLRVRAGEWDTQTKNELYAAQDRQVAEIVAHPEFHKGGLFNDIALLVLTEPFVFSEVVQTVCLPPPSTTFDLQKCFVSGWGKDAYGKAGVYQAILKKIELPIVPRSKCQDTLRAIRSQPEFTLHDSIVCAGGEAGKDACEGDGGSPLVCPIQGSDEFYHQVGIVLWGIKCGGTTPGMYADVSHLRNWIDKEMQNRDFNSSSYSHS